MIPFVFGLWLSGQSQTTDFNITFSGSGQVTNVETVIVQNLTQCTEETLSGSSTLHLANPNNIEAIDNNNSFHVYPNPSGEQCVVEFFVPESGPITVSISEVTGKIIYRNTFKIIAGKNQMHLSGLGNKLYLIQIQTREKTLIGKVVGSDPSTSDFSVNIIAGENHISKSTKSKNTIDMDYNAGDILLLKGVSGNYSNIVTLVATESTMVTFHFDDATDGDNNHYTTVIIGTQTWLAENLRTTSFIDGTAIPKKEDPTEWSQSTGPAFCWQLNDSTSYAELYGALYNWYAVSNSAKDALNLCPLGWHVPTETDWATLGSFLGGNLAAGGKLKTTCGDNWTEPNEGATNESGASIRGAGLRNSGGTFGDNLYQAYIWTSTPYQVEYARFVNVSYITSELNFYDNLPTNGFSVRCVKD